MRNQTIKIRLKTLSRSFLFLFLPLLILPSPVLSGGKRPPVKAENISPTEERSFEEPDEPAKREEPLEKDPLITFEKPKKKSASSIHRRKKIHTVRIWQETGESLWQISKKYYGNPHLWKKIYLENKKTISNPSIIFPKQKIAIPLLDE